MVTVLYYVYTKRPRRSLHIAVDFVLRVFIRLIWGYSIRNRSYKQYLNQTSKLNFI